MALGADAAIDARTPDVAGQVRQALGESADIVFGCVGIQSSMDQAIATRPLDRAAEAFELAASGRHVKVLVTVGDR